MLVCEFIWHCLCLNAMLIDRLFVIVAVVCDKDYMLCEVKLTLDVIIPELVENNRKLVVHYFCTFHDFYILY